MNSRVVLLKVKNRLQNPCFSIAVNEDRTVAATVQETGITFVSLSDFTKIEKIKVKNPRNIFYLNDEDQFAYLKMSGRIYLCSGGKQYCKGFSEEVFRFFNIDGKRFVAGSVSGITILDTTNSNRIEIFDRNFNIELAGIESDRIVSVWTRRKRIIKRSEIVYISFDGEILDRIPVERRSVKSLGPVFYVDGMGLMFADWTRKSDKCKISRITEDGRIVAQFEYSGDNCIKPIIVKSVSSSKYTAILYTGINDALYIYDRKDHSFLCRADELLFMERSVFNHPADIVFISDNELLVGGWMETMLLSIEE